MTIAIDIDPELVAEIDDLEQWEVDLILLRGRPLGRRRPIAPPPGVSVVVWTDLPRCVVTGGELYLNGEPVPGRGDFGLIRLRRRDTLELTIHLGIGGLRP
jgi:hypothetical protein